MVAQVKPEPVSLIVIAGPDSRKGWKATMPSLLKVRRTALGLLQSTLADKALTYQFLISELERQVLPETPQNVETRDRVAAVLGVPPDSLPLAPVRRGRGDDHGE